MERKEDQQMSEGEEEELKEEERQQKQAQVDLLILVKSAQNQNGLRHNDYGRYHQYCQRKIYRIRKALKFTQGKRGFQKKQITVEDAQRNNRFLQILVFQCEGYWAYAQQMKQVISKGQQQQKGEGMGARNPNRLKFHAKKRLQRAFQVAASLESISREVVDAYHHIEIQAYVSQMQAVYQIEQKDFKSALDNLIKTKIIYEKIANFKDTLEAIIYKEKIGQLETLIRMCTFNLKGGQQDENKFIDELVSKFPEKSSIEEKITKAKSESKKEKIEKIDEVTYNNKTVPLKSDRLKQVFKKIETCLHDIEVYWEQDTLDGSGQFDASTQIKNYLQLVNILEDSALIIKKEKAEESKRSDASGQLYNTLLSYVERLKLQSSIDRNLLQAKALAKRIQLETLFSSQVKLKSELRPQNIVRFIEKALKGYNSILTMERENLDPVKQLEFEFYNRFYTAQIKYYLGLHYSNERKYSEALLILKSVSGALEESVEFATKNSLLESSHVKKQVKRECEQPGGMLQTLNYLICKCHAKVLAQAEEGGKRADDEEMKEENVQKVRFDNLYDMLFDSNGHAKPESQSIRVQGDRVDFLELGGSNIKMYKGKQDEEQFKLSKHFKLINPLPKFQSVPAAPQFFDMAGAYVSYPDLTQEMEKYKAKGGLFSKMTGFFRKS